MQLMNFTAAADELRRQEFSRLSAAVTPRLEAFRSMTADAFRTEIALMLERLGHAVVSTVSDIVTTKDGRKYVTACATPTEQTPTKTPALRRLHDAIVAGNAARGFYVTPRSFTPEAEHYAASAPIDRPCHRNGIERGRWAGYHEPWLSFRIAAIAFRPRSFSMRSGYIFASP